MVIGLRPPWPHIYRPTDDQYDVGDESVNAVTLLGARIGVQQQWGKARWSAFLRGDNLSGKTYAGIVIVNEANHRYFEPAAGRSWLAGGSLGLR